MYNDHILYDYQIFQTAVLSTRMITVVTRTHFRSSISLFGMLALGLQFHYSLGFYAISQDLLRRSV